MKWVKAGQSRAFTTPQLGRSQRILKPGASLHLRSRLILALALTITSKPALATSEMLFGYGPRSSALAQSDIADGRAVTAAHTNPSLAASPGTRVIVGYSHGFTHLTLNGTKTEAVGDIAGTDLALQFGHKPGENWALGAALALHLPNRSLASVSFRPGTEPTFLRYDPAAKRATADVALAARYHQVSVGLGANILANVQGTVDFQLGQDGNGTHADGETDITLPYTAVFIAGAVLSAGELQLGARFRGAQSIGLLLDTRADIEVTGNPLNGNTNVHVDGVSGYVPATLDAGARYRFGNLKLLATLQLALWSRAPSPAANVTMDVNLGLTPGQLEAKFVRPALRDTISPKVGAELLLPNLHSLALRLGYAFSPSPVPEQPALVSHADSAFHALSSGVGLGLGTAGGIEFSTDAAFQLVLLEERSMDKPSEALPFAHFTTGGNVAFASMSLEASWL